MPPFVYNSLVSLFGLVHAQGKGNGQARGWGERIDWLSLEEGQKVSREESKPLMVIVHSTNCPACMRLKWRFATATQIFDLSKHFVMVNLATDNGEVPELDEFAPDGHYVPRIMFYSPKGSLLSNACNMHAQYKFNYESDWAIANMMNNVLDVFNN